MRLPKWLLLQMLQTRITCSKKRRKIRIAAICLGLQNALNISDNSSVYNYYGTNSAIIV